jgi:hypothetical protein
MCRSSASDSVPLLGVGSSSEEKEEEVVEVAEGKVMLVMVLDHRVKKMMAFLIRLTDWWPNRIEREPS